MPRCFIAPPLAPGIWFSPTEVGDVPAETECDAAPGAPLACSVSRSLDPVVRELAASRDKTVQDVHTVLSAFVPGSDLGGQVRPNDENLRSDELVRMMEVKIVSHSRDMCKEMQAALSASLVEGVHSGMAQRSA